MPTIIEVVAAIIWRGPRYLAVQRPAGKVQAGWWEFPGGKIEQGEAAADALIRELQEELDIRACAPRFWRSLQHSYAVTQHDAARQINLHFFHVTTFSGEARANEGQCLRWIEPQEGLNLPFLAADIAIVRALCDLPPAASLSA